MQTPKTETFVKPAVWPRFVVLQRFRSLRSVGPKYADIFVVEIDRSECPRENPDGHDDPSVLRILRIAELVTVDNRPESVYRREVESAQRYADEINLEWVKFSWSIERELTGEEGQR